MLKDQTHFAKSKQRQWQRWLEMNGAFSLISVN